MICFLCQSISGPVTAHQVLGGAAGDKGVTIHGSGSGDCCAAATGATGCDGAIHSDDVVQQAMQSTGGTHHIKDTTTAAGAMPAYSVGAILNDHVIIYLLRGTWETRLNSVCVSASYQNVGASPTSRPCCAASSVACYIFVLLSL